jgi:predicted glycosyltransferase
LKIWYDACTGKHVRYGFAISQRLKSLGHDVILTTRRHPDTLALLDLLDADFKIVGEYSPTSAHSRLQKSLKRQLVFSKMFDSQPLDYAMSHGSIDLCRVAFGLGVNLLSTADSPHAVAANKLALPLVDVLITSKAIPTQEYTKFGVNRIIQFNGVDEVAWTKNCEPKQREHDRPIIVIRQMETMASYAKNIPDTTEQIALKLTSLGDVMFIPRYERKPRPGLLVPSDFVDSVKLAAKADLVVSVGGTISREAALQGTPSIVIRTFGKSYVNDYLTNCGFPLFTSEPSEVLKLARKHVGRKLDVKRKLQQLENPVDYIEKIIQLAL